MHRSTRERFVGLETMAEESGYERALRELETIRSLVIQDVEAGINRMLLLAHHRRLSTALDETWADIQEGRVAVESIQVLRALRITHIPDLWQALAEPVMRHSRVIRETKFISNLILNVVRPKLVSLQYMMGTKQD